MAKKKDWREGEMILTFKLNKIDTSYTPAMMEWLTVDIPNFDEFENSEFEKLLRKTRKISVWSEENLKMKFIGPVLELGEVLDSDKFVSFFDKSLEAEVRV
jgi:hypothetical protein